MTAVNYDESSIKSLDPLEHIRLRPGMYIGKLGDGSSYDDGIYVLIKEVIDNAIDEYVMGYGKTIELTVKNNTVTVRDYGRGIPLGKLEECVSQINTGAKYDDKVFKKAVGLNGVGTKAVNGLSSLFKAQAIRDGRSRTVEFAAGKKVSDITDEKCDLQTGTIISFVPDPLLFGQFHFISEYIERLIRNYVYLNNGLKIYFNGTRFFSQNGLSDLLEENMDAQAVYPIVHLKDTDFEFAFTHYANKYGEEYYSFVNGQHTTQGGTHQSAFREAFIKTIREFYKKDFDPSDIRTSIVAAISIKIQEPMFESQTKTKLGSTHLEPNGQGQSVRNFIIDAVKTKLDNFLHKNSDIAEALLRKIQMSEKERKEIAGIKKIARESLKKVSLHNKKLRDCKIHLDTQHERNKESTLFITEGDSASGSITKARDVQTQAVFSLKGKPMNCFNATKKVVYENEEFNLLQAALNIEEGIENLRYNNIVIATDADVDGMHIRLLLLTFFLQFYPELIKGGYVSILQTPLFRVRNKKETIYCYSEEEKQHAMQKLGAKPEITRFKGLGEISPDEFKQFIGAHIRLEPVILSKDISITNLLAYYMGKNTPERQNFIIDNLRIELDIIEKEEDKKIEEPALV